MPLIYKYKGGNVWLLVDLGFHLPNCWWLPNPLDQNSPLVKDEMAKWEMGKRGMEKRSAGRWNPFRAKRSRDLHRDSPVSPSSCSHCHWKCAQLARRWWATSRNNTFRRRKFGRLYFGQSLHLARPTESLQCKMDHKAHFEKLKYRYIDLLNLPIGIPATTMQCTMAQALNKFGIKDFTKIMTLAPIFFSQDYFR